VFEIWKSLSLIRSCFQKTLEPKVRPASNITLSLGNLIMKTAMIIVALLGFSSVVAAQDGAANTQPVEQYGYGTHLDVAKVISEDPVPDVCAVVPTYMTYQDLQGKQHVLAYDVMGRCSQG
jgi:hypothetical protein